MRPAVALSIAGSDPSGGAGIQADLKTFGALGAYGACVITALTAQNTTGVFGVHEVPADFVVRQLETLASDVRLDAIKIGMLANAEIIEAVTEFVGHGRAEHVVLDPVMIASSGDRLLRDDAIDAMRILVPLVSLVTPNLVEAAALLETAPARSVTEMTEQATRLVRFGAKRVLLTGGHLDTGDEVADVLAGATGYRVLRGPRIPTENTHGTGCSLSAAVAALRPQRSSWRQAVEDAKAWLTNALAAADTLQLGHGRGPVHHFAGIWNS
jgi:hydroxymethylpyrimidine/phosphomethylpyrimidine kinase